MKNKIHFLQHNMSTQTKGLPCISAFSLLFIYTILCILYLMVESKNVRSNLDPQNGVGPTIPFWKSFVGLNSMFSPLLWIYCKGLCKTITHFLRPYKSKEDLGQSWERKTDYLFQNMKVCWDVLSWHGQMLAVKIFDPGTISLSIYFQSHERRNESLMLMNSWCSICEII